MLLTAGLAAGQAQAAAVTDIADINASEDSTLVFDGDPNGNRLALQITENSVLNKDLEINTSDATTGHYIKTSGTASDSAVHVLNGNGHNISITGNGGADEKVFTFGSSSVTPKLQITNLGTLTIDGAKVNLTTPNSSTNSSNNQVGVDVGAQNIRITNGALVNLNNNTVGSGSNKANTILRGINMEITGADTVVDAQGNETYAGSDITVNDATLNFYGAVVNQNSDANNKVLGGTKGYAAQVQGNTLNATNAVININADHDLSGASGSYGGAGAILGVHTSTLTNSYLNIDDQATLSLEMREYNKDDYYKKTKGWDGTGRDYNGSLTIDGGVVVIDGVLRHTKGGLLEIKDGTQLTGGAKMADLSKSGEPAKNENKLDNAIYLGIYGNAANSSLNNQKDGLSGSFANSKLSTLRLSSNKLDEFLNSKDEVITDKAGNKITDNQGQLVVHHGAHIEFTDQQQVEMSKFVFDNDAGAGHISTAIAATNGSTTIGGDQAMIGNPNDTVPNEVDGTRTIMAQNMSIGQSLLKSDSYTGDALAQIKSGNSSLAFRFEANDMVPAR